MFNPNRRHNSKAFIARMLTGIVAGQSAEEFAEEQMRRMNCDWCAAGTPMDAAGTYHELLGMVLACENVQESECADCDTCATGCPDLARADCS